MTQTADRPPPRIPFARRLAASAGLGFAGGVALASGLLACDSFGLHSLMSSGNMPLATMALFALGLGVTLSPVSVATALSLPGSETPPTGRTAHP